MEKQSVSFDYITENIKRIKDSIGEAAVKCGRAPQEIILEGVTKTIDCDRINFALENGIEVIGENKVQELLLKKDELKPCERHLIGHLQSNKVKKIVGEVKMIESVDSVALAKEIAKYSLMKGAKTEVLLQINSGNEENKFGFTLEEIEERAFEISEISGIRVKGLMCVAPISEKDSEIREIFSKVYKKYIDIRAKMSDNSSMEILSMGMSGDFIQAIYEGSTMVRVGSAIFGNRVYN